MKRAELHFDLPQELIAQSPLARRDDARMMVVDRARGSIAHHQVRDLPEVLRPNDCLVVNRTRVLPARFAAQRPTGGKVRGLFAGMHDESHWKVLLAGRGRLRLGDELTLGDGRWTLRLTEQRERGEWLAQVTPSDSPTDVLNAVGVMPLPPYIQRNVDDGELGALDRQRYQTVYADRPGAVAAPTAGLHFTGELLSRLEAIGVARASVVLHVGLGTFRPVEVDDLAAHEMHSEDFELATDVAEQLNRQRAVGGRLVAVGTTSVRVLESCAVDGKLVAGSGATNILIYPPYRFAAVDVLMTNFHLPESTLLALVYAFGGTELMRHAYQVAVAERYRFFSYGDCMLIL